MPALEPTKKLAWDYPFPLLIDGFRVYANGVMVHQINDRNILEVVIGDLGLDNATEYTVSVTAYLGARESQHSGAVNFTYLEFVPVPQNLRIG